MTLDRRLIDQMVADVGPEAFGRLAALFQEETWQSIEDITHLAAAPAEKTDWRELGRRAHSLKHAATSFGLVGLAAVAFRIEQAADAGDKAVVENRTASLKAVAEMELGVFGDVIKPS
ncbi:MAG TPA: Hpt domain-containing protein [Dongiaceae bacterium]|jgi:HPt (histidine-containing phosphotransfer) domain-containing protein